MCSKMMHYIGALCRNSLLLGLIKCFPILSGMNLGKYSSEYFSMLP